VVAGVFAIDASPVGVFYDDALYAILGKALATGQGYRYINVPGAPVAVHYPPGYPALLALLWRISPEFPENLALFKFANAALLGVVAFFTHRFATRRLGFDDLAAAGVALAATITVPALLLSSNVISEIFFLALLLPLLIHAEGGARRRGVSEAAFLGVIAGLLCLVRSHAIALLPAIAIVHALDKRYREAVAVIVAGAAALAPWLLWVHRFDPLIPDTLRGQYGSYAAWFLDGVHTNGVGLLIGSLVQNLTTCWAIVARSFSPVTNPAIDAVAVTAVLVLMISGAKALARQARVTLVFVACYAVIVLVWPFSPLRFVWGIWPLLVLMMASGAGLMLRPSTLQRSARARAIRIGGAVATAVVLLGALTFNVRGYVNGWWATVSRSVGPRIQPQLVWVADHTLPSDVIAADDEGAVYLYTGRLAIPAAAFTTDQYLRARQPPEDAAFIGQTIARFRPTFLIAWAVPTQQAAKLLTTTRPPILIRVDTVPGGLVFRHAP
jgi:hypothetical protein